MNRFIATLAGVAIAATMVLVAVPTAAAPDPRTGPASIASRQFTATGDLGRYYTKQTVTGTYKNRRARPLNVTVYDYLDRILVVSAKPKLDTAYDQNYWHDTYGLDQWYVGENATAVFHLMLPPPPMGSTFTALLITDFKGDGNWQNWMDGTSTKG